MDRLNLIGGFNKNIFPTRIDIKSNGNCFKKVTKIMNYLCRVIQASGVGLASAESMSFSGTKDNHIPIQEVKKVDIFSNIVLIGRLKEAKEVIDIKKYIFNGNEKESAGNSLTNPFLAHKVDNKKILKLDNLYKLDIRNELVEKCRELESKKQATNDFRDNLLQVIDNEELSFSQIKRGNDDFINAKNQEIEAIEEVQKKKNEISEYLEKEQNYFYNIIKQGNIAQDEIIEVNNIINKKKSQLLEEQIGLGKRRKDLNTLELEINKIVEETDLDMFSYHQEDIKEFFSRYNSTMDNNYDAVESRWITTKETFDNAMEKIDNNSSFTKHEKQLLLENYCKAEKQERRVIESILVDLEKLSEETNKYQNIINEHQCLSLLRGKISSELKINQKKQDGFRSWLNERINYLNDEKAFIRSTLDNVAIREEKPKTIKQILDSIKSNVWTGNTADKKLLKQMYGISFLTLVIKYHSNPFSRQNIEALIDWVNNPGVIEKISDDKIKKVVDSVSQFTLKTLQGISDVNLEPLDVEDVPVLGLALSLKK